ncbi:CDP-alcohol phosphatidyltransferase family protein [Alloscardovia theropitheci]|uniref:CDP-alcohol phosphatidyltransferase family protein n=1 Tax=Alloscardovia theropitheci TaxID=2496842 RepID=A0A4R0QTE5_9BIFI|nr:CDP-alcohol phosphatidyltransferase family protein [Alloscardovia theropitheci]TCD54798.1 CDP-alcohol phosphatidyltransferase family protein [Alloscardovia theropitheci]
MDEQITEEDELTLKLKPSNKIITWPNFVSLIRLLTIPVIALLIDKGHLFAGLVVLAISALSDALDGYLARTLNQITKLGQILDPLADRLLIVFSILALGFANIIPWWFIIVVASREAVLAVLVFILAQYDYGPLPVHFVGKTATAMIMCDVPILMISRMGTSPLFQVIGHIGIAMAVWGIALYWVAGLIYIRQGVRLIRHEIKNQHSALSQGDKATNSVQAAQLENRRGTDK